MTETREKPEEGGAGTELEDEVRTAADKSPNEDSQPADLDMPSGDEAGADEDDASDSKDESATPEKSEEILERYTRLRADFENFRRNSRRELDLRWQVARIDLISEMLGPLDDLARVTDWEADSDAGASFLEGVRLVLKKMHDVLARTGVEEVDAQGELFDPNTMEATMKAEPPSEDDEGRVQMVLQKGYTLRGKLVRPAMVSVYASD